MLADRWVNILAWSISHEQGILDKKLKWIANRFKVINVVFFSFAPLIFPFYIFYIFFLLFFFRCFTRHLLYNIRTYTSKYVIYINACYTVEYEVDIEKYCLHFVFICLFIYFFFYTVCVNTYVFVNTDFYRGSNCLILKILVA